MGKRTIWIAEGALAIIGGIALFLNQKEVTLACVAGIIGTMNMLKDND